MITQSPSSKGFSLIALPAEEGSWKWTVALALGSNIHALGTAAPDTAFGWLTKSAVEYVVQETLGFSPDFDETLGPQIQQYRSKAPRQAIDNNLSIERFDSLIEKTESGIKSIHRPIIASESAATASFNWRTEFQSEQLEVYADAETFDYVDKIITSEDFETFSGHVSSYNANTFKGRIYIAAEQRTVPFELADTIRNLATISSITRSLSRNAASRLRSSDVSAILHFTALKNETQNGRLKSIYVTEVE